MSDESVDVQQDVETQDVETKPELTPEDLKQELGRARRDAKRYRSERNQIEADFRLAAEERERVAKELEQLRGDLRQRDHKSKFAELAKGLKVRPEAVDDLWSLTGYQADADQVDAEKMTRIIAQAVESRPYLLAVDKPLEPGPGLSKGAPDPGGYFLVRRDDTLDGAWLMKNQAAYHEAVRNNKIRYIGE